MVRLSPTSKPEVLKVMPRRMACKSALEMPCEPDAAVTLNTPDSLWMSVRPAEVRLWRAAAVRDSKSPDWADVMRTSKPV